MIGMLIYPDFQLLDAAGPIAAFEIAARLAGNAHDIKVLAVKPGPCVQFVGGRDDGAGFPLGWPDHHADRGRRRGSCGPALDPKTLAFARAIARRGVRIASVCSGAYILAEAGFLDGRRATTHWQRKTHFLKAYPVACSSSPTGSSSATAISGAPPASPPASTCRSP